MKSKTFNFSFEAIGTIVEISLLDSDKELIPNITSEFERFENKYSRFIEDSFLSKLNSSVGKKIKLDSETKKIIEKAEEISKLTNGFFDITMKETLDNLGYDSKYSFVSKKAFPKFKLKKGYEIKGDYIILHEQIDFGGIGKGILIDNVCEFLEMNGVEYYYINAGGDIRVKSNSEPHGILLEHPNNPEMAIGVVNILDGSIASSSSNRRNWKGGHHLINPKKKKPANDMKCVFVLADKSYLSDSLATGLYVMGFDEAIKISKKNKLSVLLVSKNDKMFVSESFNVELFN